MYIRRDTALQTAAYPGCICQVGTAPVNPIPPIEKEWKTSRRESTLLSTALRSTWQCTRAALSATAASLNGRKHGEER